MNDDNLTEVYSYLVETIFAAVIRSDPVIIQDIQSFGGDLVFENNSFLFTLPALFEFVLNSYERNTDVTIEASRKNYLRFRKLIYSNPTNRELRKLGGLVEIEIAGPTHDLSRYRLLTHGQLRE